ncbi:MAG: pseudouridine-5'-phosphate glycosidase [Spirochaetales bacterium]|nr:pseudouridine-5'-phosphate glycosidase [Spirochaetales bacterium]
MMNGWNNINKELVDIAPEVKEAVESGQGVVALESTIISHGMPYPQNVETALEVEKIVRSEGAVPATIALLDGKFKVGLKTDEIDMLGKTGRDVIKCSRRDLPFVLARKQPGATTVAATMIGAALGGIRMFATGGIGGVHRGAPATFDISADLDELARTDVAVVCAGAKAILDLPLTLEYLETRGVPVVGFGTEELPAFYTRESGLGVDYRVDSEAELARALDIKWKLGLSGGAVVANPIPEEFSMDRDHMDGVIARALDEMHNLGIKGKESTPFLLGRIAELTDGDSLFSNIKLVYNNARIASRTAMELAKLA